MGPSTLPPFFYYSDGEYEYRIHRGSDNSAPGFPGMRKWSLCDRPLLPAGGSWTDACHCYIDNVAEINAAEKRLLGLELLAECERYLARTP